MTQNQSRGRLSKSNRMKSKEGMTTRKLQKENNRRRIKKIRKELRIKRNSSTISNANRWYFEMSTKKRLTPEKILRKEKKVLQATIVREKRNKRSKAVRSGSSTKDQGWKIKVEIEMIANSRITKRRTKKVVANVSIWKIQQKQELEGEKGGLMNNQQPKSSFSNPKRGKQNRHSATFKREAKRMHKIEEMQTLSYLKIKLQMKRSSKAWKETRWKANDNKKIRIKEGMEMSWGIVKNIIPISVWCHWL